MNNLTTRAAGLPALFEAAADPLLTFYDDDSGERTCLSPAQLRSWAGRTARMLVDGCGVRPGALTAVMLPPHWQTAAVLLGAWSAGMAVDFHGEATAGLPRLGSGAGQPADVVFVAAHRVDNWIDEVPPAPHRFVLGGPAEGYVDYLTEVQRYRDDSAVTPHPAGVATVDGTSYGQWAELAQAIAKSLGLGPGDRLLVDGGANEHPLKWLLAPLAVGASVVVCANLDPSRLTDRIRAERVTRVLR